MPIMIQNSKTKLMCGGSQIAKMYCQGDVIYSSGNIVTYHVDSGITYQEEVDEGESCLSPKTFTPAKSGWEFVGWRSDTTANGTVLTSKVMGDSPVTLYAVFRQTVTLTYKGNGNTEGSTAEQTGTRYFNSGNYANPSFTLQANGFSKTDYKFTAWALGSASGTQYAAGSSITLSSNTTVYAVWEANGISTSVTARFLLGVTHSSMKDTPNWVYGWYDTPYDLTNVKTLTFSIYYSYLCGGDKTKYFYDAFDYFVGVSQNKSSFIKSTGVEKFGNLSYSTSGSGSGTYTLDVSDLTGLYYIGAATRGMNRYDNSNLVESGYEYGVKPDYYVTIQNVSFA